MLSQALLELDRGGYYRHYQTATEGSAELTSV